MMIAVLALGGFLLLSAYGFYAAVKIAARAGIWDLPVVAVLSAWPMLLVIEIFLIVRMT